MSNWTLVKDFKKTDWKGTAIYNLERAFAAGLVWIPLTLIVNKETTASLLLFPLVYFVYLVPLRLIAYFICSLDIPLLCPILSFCSLIGSIAVVVGDPLVFLLFRILPRGYIPVENPRFFQFDVIVYVMKVEKKAQPEYSQSEWSETPDYSTPRSAEESHASFVTPPTASETGLGSGAPGASFADSVVANSLIDQAVVLEAKSDSDSVEKAHILWEQALRMGGLSPRNELLSHYYLAPYYQQKESLAEAIKHHEKVAIGDPNLTFLDESDETVRVLLRADLFKSLTAAYQFYARTTIKEREGIESAIGYIERKLDIIGKMAAPSLLVELACYYGLEGRHQKAREAFGRAVEAPTYGADFQEEAKKSAADFLAEEAPAEPKPKKAEEPDQKKAKIVRQESAQFLGNEEIKKGSPALKLAGGGTLGVAAIIGLFLVLMPNPYKEYFTKAQEAFKSGEYSEALTLINLAKEKKSTAELSNLETEVRYQIKEIEAREAKERLQREYADLYQKARGAFGRQDLASAENYARLAAGKKSTPEIASLTRQIQTAGNRKLERERREALSAADDAAYKLADRLNTELGFSEYIRTYPEGRNKYAALNQLATLRGRQARTQVAAQTGPVPVSQFPATTGAVSSPQASEYWNELKRELQKAVMYLGQRTSATAPYARIYQEQRRVRQSWRLELNKSLSAADDALNKALSITQKMTNREAESSVLNWRSRLQRVRTQLKGFNGEQISYRTQRSIVTDIQSYIAR